MRRALNKGSNILPGRHGLAPLGLCQWNSRLVNIDIAVCIDAFRFSFAMIVLRERVGKSVHVSGSNQAPRRNVSAVIDHIKMWWFRSSAAEYCYQQASRAYWGTDRCDASEISEDMG